MILSANWKLMARRWTVEHVFLRFELERCYCSDDEPDPLSKHLDQDRWRFRRFTNTIVTIGLLGPLCQLPLWMIRFENVSFPLEADWKSAAIDSAIDSAFEFVWCCLRQKFTLTFVSFCIPCFAVVYPVYPFGAAAGLAIRCPCRRWTKFVWCTFSVWRETLRKSQFSWFFFRDFLIFSKDFLRDLLRRSWIWQRYWLGAAVAEAWELPVRSQRATLKVWTGLDLEIVCRTASWQSGMLFWKTRKQRNMSLRREHQFPDNCENKSFVEHGMSGSSKILKRFCNFRRLRNDTHWLHFHPTRFHPTRPSTCTGELKDFEQN